MAKIRSRSRVASLQSGATDSKYLKLRPDTELSPMNHEGNEIMTRNRRALNMLNGFQQIETPDKVSPGATR